VKNWTVAEIPSQAGRIAIVTGATSGIGYETALALAGAGARVVLASRNEAKGAEMLSRIRAQHPAADISFEPLDLADLKSVEAFAERIFKMTSHINLLINNAGVMAIPTRHVTVDGFEMQLAANYLGHFALTLRLLPRILGASRARIVTVSSLAHRTGRIHFDDLQLEKRYTPWSAYCQSKLATLLLGLELERRARANNWPLISVAAHPGFAATGLQSAGPSMGRNTPSLFERFTKLLEPYLSQTAAGGALPTLYAATSPDAEGGVMYGPDGFYEMKGPPRKAKIVPGALDRAVWERLWNVSETLTGVSLERAEAA
jgi:NAD(P)-dependent dehydrogenase (short-subunit alcohol dehydrogenase family)